MVLKIYVNNNFLIYLFYFIVLAIAGNKDDMYADEEVEESEVKNFADELNAIFQKTSAKSSNGIEDLFVKIGKKFLNPKSDGSTGPSGNIYKNGPKTDKSQNIQLNKKNSGGKQKKGCC